MTKEALDAQIAKDKQVIEALDGRLKELYKQELRSVIDRSAAGRSAPQNRVILSY